MEQFSHEWQERYSKKDFAKSFAKLSQDERLQLVRWFAEDPQTPFPELTAPALSPTEKQQLLDFALEVNIRVKREQTIEEELETQKIIDEYKSHRDQKSSPDTIRRNIEICDLRKQNPKHWSLARLKNKYQLSIRSISLILGSEAEQDADGGEDEEDDG